MKKDIADNFFSSYEWWNNFFWDLKALFEKISTVIEREFGYSEKFFYYYKTRDNPSMPSAYYLGLAGEDEIKLQLAVILDKEYLTGNIIAANEPIILATLHDYKDNNVGITYNILEGKNIKQISEENGVISGILDWETEVKFDAFRVPLDLFEKYDDKTVKEHIISRINEISNKK